AALGAGGGLNVIAARQLPAGWTGKLWAQNEGVESAAQVPNPPEYLLLTDADIVFTPGALSSLVARAEKQRLVLNSLMGKLRCKSFSERLFVPALVFFFPMLFPFASVDDPRRATACAAAACWSSARRCRPPAGSPRSAAR